LTTDELIRILDTLNIETTNTRGSEVNGYCPGHLGRTGHIDRNPSWWINADTGAHICFSCGFKGGLNFLIAYLNGTPIEQSDDWVTSTLGKRLEAALKPKPKPKEEYFSLTEANLAAFVDVPLELRKSRGLTASATTFYEILYDNQKESWILPIRDPHTNKLWGWQEKGVFNRYFKNFPAGIHKSKALFGYKNVQQFDQMVVVESPLDAARLMSVGVHGGVSTYGSIISIDQLNLIRGAGKIIFALDNDDAGKASSEEMLKKSKEFNFECWFFNYRHTDQKDVGGMSKEEIEIGLANAKHSLHGRRALL